MATVYVVQENNRMDYSPAEDYGTVKFLTIEEYRPMKGSLRNQEILKTIERSLVSFNPVEDFLVLTGSPILIGYVFHLALSIAMLRGRGSVKCLQWDRMYGSYRLVEFNLPGES